MKREEEKVEQSRNDKTQGKPQKGEVSGSTWLLLTARFLLFKPQNRGKMQAAGNVGPQCLTGAPFPRWRPTSAASSGERAEPQKEHYRCEPDTEYSSSFMIFNDLYIERRLLTRQEGEGGKKNRSRAEAPLGWAEERRRQKDETKGGERIPHFREIQRETTGGEMRS